MFYISWNLSEDNNLYKLLCDTILKEG